MTTPHMMPVRRDIRFALPADRAHDWHVQGAPGTHFMTGGALRLPAGER